MSKLSEGMEVYVKLYDKWMLGKVVSISSIAENGAIINVNDGHYWKYLNDIVTRQDFEQIRESVDMKADFHEVCAFNYADPYNMQQGPTEEIWIGGIKYAPEQKQEIIISSPVEALTASVLKEREREFSTIFECTKGENKMNHVSVKSLYKALGIEKVISNDKAMVVILTTGTKGIAMKDDKDNWDDNIGFWMAYGYAQTAAKLKLSKKSTKELVKKAIKRA